jgi:predicted transcriptional regulator
MRKPGPPKDIPPPLELECLKVLWSLGEGNVHKVREALSSHRGLAYTTVMTILDRLEKRGAATRTKSGRSYVYAPKLSRDALRRVAVKELVSCYFDGEAEKLREYLTLHEPEAREAPQDLDAALL